MTTKPSTTINPSIFKAYDVRGLYPSEVNEEAARQIGRGFVSYLQAKTIAVSRDMRLSSPSLTTAFVEGARAQGADVVDYGMMGTDMLYFAVARDRHDGGVQITASHNPKEYNGIKMVRRDAFPLSGDEGISDIRDLLVEGRLPAESPRPGGLSQMDVLQDYVAHVMAFIDPSIIKPFNVVLDAGSGMAGVVRSSVSKSTGPFRITKPTRSSKKTGATSSSASSATAPTSASPGMETQTGCSSSTAPASSLPAIS
jgi:phosphomannomutase